MRVHEDGSVLLNRDEVAAVAKVLDLGRQLSEQLGADDEDADEDTVEVALLETIDLLEDLGVSSEELLDELASRRRPV